jgi:hypothetical protein
MDVLFGTMILLSVAAVAAVIVWPFFTARSSAQSAHANHRTAALLRQRADLLAGRNSLYRALQDLDFDHETNKISDEDYAIQRRRVVARAVAILQQLDAMPSLPEDDPIEAAVRAYRGGASTPTQAAGRFCPRCGAAVSRTDKFCGACGAPLD